MDPRQVLPGRICSCKVRLAHVADVRVAAALVHLELVALKELLGVEPLLALLALWGEKQGFGWSVRIFQCLKSR